MPLEDEFEKDMYAIYQKQRELHIYAVIFKQMLDEHRGVETAKRLLATDQVQEGLTRLWELDMLGDSMEALVIQPKYESLFKKVEIEEARKRLADRDYFKAD